MPRSWRPYVHLPDCGIDRQHWALCLLSEFRGALRGGEIWVQGSRRYTDPERFLMARADWTGPSPARARGSCTSSSYPPPRSRG